MQSLSSFWTSLHKYNACCLVILATLTPILSMQVPFSPKSKVELSRAISSCVSSAAKASTTQALVALDEFCHRQFDDPENCSFGTCITMAKDKFMMKISEEIARLGGSKALVDGYLQKTTFHFLATSIPNTIYTLATY